MDRIGRSTAHVATLMAELHRLSVSQYYHSQSVDTSTPYGQAMIQMAAVFSNLEREIIVERVNAGFNRARAQGKVLGRQSKTTEEKAEEIRQGKARGDALGSSQKPWTCPTH